MSSYILCLKDVDKTKLSVVGGKGANLGELTRIEGLFVPDGFCISTEAFKRVIRETSSIDKLLYQLSLLTVANRDKISELASEVRRVIEGIAIPQDINEEVTYMLSRLEEKSAFAVRSSATAEDLPMTSFAGQLDTYLNIIGKKAILKHISKCWASLFTERAIVYRIQNGFDHRKVHLSVIVQKMVFPQAAGILFTADPVTSNRKMLTIDASFGLGEALVSGIVNPDIYKVFNGRVIDKKISAKKLAIDALKEGGTKEIKIEPEKQERPVLTNDQILRLEHIGRKIEEHFGRPQDIEWCLVKDAFYILQSRPITTLYPIPETNDRENHVFISVGHQQMMTDPLKPLGLSFFQLTAFRPMFKAGGRLFVDVTHQLSSPVSRENLLNLMGQHDPLIRDALNTIIERGDFLQWLPEDKQEPRSGSGNKKASFADFEAPIKNDPLIVFDLIKNSQTSIEELNHTIQAKSGSDVFDFILDDIQQLKKSLSDPQIMGVIMTAINASTWINEKMWEWLGEKNVADTISQSAPNNITSEMGLALLQVADIIRPYPEVINYLQHVKDDNYLDELLKFDGGKEAEDAIRYFLKKYGMRCAGEIDITKTRWREKPTMIVRMILSNIKNFEPKAANLKFDQGRREALKKEQELLDRLKQLSDGEQKAKKTKLMIDFIRNFIGYREYPKYAMVNRYFIYKQALLKEAEKLFQARIIHTIEDIYFLRFEELREVVRMNKLDYQIINKEKEEFRLYEKLTPPRVITSDGEIIAGRYKRENIPVNAMVGLPVSSGVAEGRARVILNMEDADLKEGDILITSFTDPSWTPLFVSISGIVTEVGGMMTHGAVIAREYGLPAVVGVENASKKIKDGQRIRVNGSDGYVEIL